jgi:hypothetical protein
VSDDWLILAELLLVFGLVFGFGIRELLWLRRDRRERERARRGEGNVAGPDGGDDSRDARAEAAVGTEAPPAVGTDAPPSASPGPPAGR